jgi:hypothetical protein
LKEFYSEEWQRTCLKWLEKSFHTINSECLNGLLTAPQFTIDDSCKRFGLWTPATRTISLSANHLLNDIWLEVELTLRHEMAHQYVSEILQAPGSRPHGPLFKRACVLLGLESSPRNQEPTAPKIKRVYERVQKLMQLSASSNQHEAESAVSAAQRLLLKHNIEIAETEEEKHLSYRWIGTPRIRISLEEKLLSGILQDHFFVRGIWVQTLRVNSAKPLRILEIVGSHQNIELADYTHQFLSRTLDELWATYRMTSESHLNGRSVRNSFRIGVLMGFRKRLESESRGHAEKGLIWLGDSAIDEFLKERHPYMASMRSGHYRTGDAHKAGLEKGRKLRVKKGVKGTSGKGKRLKRLPF